MLLEVLPRLLVLETDALDELVVVNFPAVASVEPGLPSGTIGGTVTDSSNEFAFRCTGVEKRYGDVVAVDGLSLSVRRGECFGLLGPNGAGKTTTIEILEGLLAPDAGDVEVLGLRWARDEHALRQRLGIQLQETQLADKLTVEETLRLFRSFYRRGREVDDLLRMVELESKRKSWVVKLSGGQRQRLSVACALAGSPDILFLDEPTTGLDPQSRRQLWGVLNKFRADGGTILLTTHYMDEAEVLCDRVAIVDKGKVIALDTPKALIATLGEPKVITHHGTLEDVFMARTGRHLREE
jgi:ABC-2 type transport system ATP-binding protein